MNKQDGFESERLCYRGISESDTDLLVKWRSNPELIYIRADGNSRIGAGHLMRCLSIADAVKKLGAGVVFIVADSCSRGMIEERGYRTVCLDSKWSDLNNEIDKMVSLIRDEKVDKLVIDSYYVTREYLKRLRELTKIVYIDDLNAFHYPCDTLINYNCYAGKFEYPERYPKTELLLGCEYAPLREEFQIARRETPKKDVESILITTGGIDPYNSAVKLVKMAKMLAELKSVKFHVVIGQFYLHEEELNHLKSEYAGVVIHKRAHNMARLMLDCDIAVSAGGSTLYELCACGAPTVAFSVADNQLEGVNYFGGGLMINAGDIRVDEEHCLARILKGICLLTSDYQLRVGLSEKCQRLVDGKGAIRIAEALVTDATKENI